MIKPLAIDHIVLRTTDLDTMLHFYTQVLGCTLERQLEPEIGLTQLRAGNALIDLVTVDSELGRKGGAAPIQTDNNLDHFCLQIAPFKEAELLEYLASHHVEVTEFTDRYGAQGFSRTIYIKDPQGNTVELKAQR